MVRNRDVPEAFDQFLARLPGVEGQRRVSFHHDRKRMDGTTANDGRHPVPEVGLAPQRATASTLYVAYRVNDPVEIMPPTSPNTSAG